MFHSSGTPLTRRIALAILLTVWALLVAGGAVVYLTVRAALVNELDESLMARALAAPEMPRASTRAVGPAAPVAADDEDALEGYVIEGAVAKISPPAGGRAQGRGTLMWARFTRVAG